MSQLMMARYKQPLLWIVVGLALFGISALGRAGFIFDNTVTIGGVMLGLFGTIFWLMFVIGPRLSKNTMCVPALLLYLIMPLLILVPVSSCIFLNSEEKIYIIGDTTTVTHDLVFAIPFYHHIEMVHREPQYYGVETVAITKDGKKVQVILYPEIRFLADESLLLRLSQKVHGVERVTLEKFRQVTKRNFSRVAAQYDLADLHIGLVLEWETGSLFDEKELADIGLELAGTLQIKELHPYFGKGA